MTHKTGRCSHGQRPGQFWRYGGDTFNCETAYSRFACGLTRMAQPCLPCK